MLGNTQRASLDRIKVSTKSRRAHKVDGKGSKACDGMDTFIDTFTLMKSEWPALLLAKVSKRMNWLSSKVSLVVDVGEVVVHVPKREMSKSKTGKDAKLPLVAAIVARFWRGRSLWGVGQSVRGRQTNSGWTSNFQVWGEKNSAKGMQLRLE